MNLLMTGDPMMAGVIGLVCVVALILSGIPVALAIFAVGFVGQALLFDISRASSQLFQAVFGEGMDLMLASVPLFVFMGQLIAASTIARDLFDGIYKWIGRVPGGIAVTGVVSGAGFGAVTGVSAAAVATMSTIALPQMERYKYDMRLAAGSIASSSALAILVPPSLLMIIYGIATESSIGDLFIAGLFPAVLLTLSFALYIVFVAMREPGRAPRGESHGWVERLRAISAVVPVAAIFTIIIGGIYSGAFTPSEAAGVGAFVILVYLTVTRRLSWRILMNATTETIRLTAMIYFIFIAVTLLTSFLVLTGVIDSMVGLITGAELPAFAVMLGIVVIYMLLGMILDGIGMMLLTLPVTFPIIVSLGYDPIWFGIIVTLLVEIGLVTPPVGLNCFILKQVYPSIPLGTVFRGVAPFVVITLAWVIAFIVWPQAILWVL